MTSFSVAALRQRGLQLGTRLRRHSADRPSFRTLLLIGCVLAYLLTLVYIHRSLPAMHVDEGFQIALSSRSLPEITTSLTQDMHPPLYSYLLHFWMRLFGDGVTSARSFSIVTSLLGSVIFYRWLRHRLGIVPSLLGTGIYASFAMHLVYAVVARNYALLLLAVVATLGYVYRTWSLPLNRGRLLGLVGLQTALLYTHNLAIPLLAAGYAFFYVSKPTRDRLRYYSLGLALTGVAFLPWALVILNQLGIRAGEAGWLSFEPLADLHEIASAVVPKLEGGRRYIAWILAGGLYVYSTRVWRRQVSPYARTTAVILGLSILCMYVLSFRQPLFYDRYLMVTLPLLAYLLAHALPREKLSQIGIGLLIILANLAIFQEVQQDFRNGDFYDIEQGLYSRDEASVTVIDLPTYYYHLEVLGYENIRVFDPERDSPAWSGVALMRPEDYLSSADLEGVRQIQYLSQHKRPFEEYFARAGYRVAKQRSAGSVEVYLLEKN